MNRSIAHLIKKTLKTLFISLFIVVPTTIIQAQSETQINSKYHDEIISYIREDLQKKEKAINKQAEKILLSLPNSQKLYDETMVHIKLDIGEGLREDGTTEYNLIYTITYDNKHIDGVTDDYPTGVYDWNNSNSCRAICNLTKTVVEGACNEYFNSNHNVTIQIHTSTDGVNITKVPYGGEYGDFRYCPVEYNNEHVRLSISKEEGITDNAQLGYIRAQSIKDYIEKNIPLLRRDDNKYIFSTTNHERQGGRFRRSSIELIVHGIFDQKAKEMTAKLTQDAYVDFNIPEVEPGSNDHAFALIIANEDYPSPMPPVPFAANDGNIFYQYCIKTLGIPERHIKLIPNASRNEIRTDAIKWVKDITIALKGEANIIIFYAGHGTTDEQFKPYLIPCDITFDKLKSLTNGKSSFGNETIELTKSETKSILAQSIGIDSISAWFNKVPVKSITFFIDASFNGTQRNGSPLFTNKITSQKYKSPKVRNDILIMAASDFNKTAYAYDDQHHGFFTYFLLKELKRTAGNITLEELFNNINTSLSYESSLQGKLQQPSVVPGGKLKELWQTQKLK